MSEPEKDLPTQPVHLPDEPDFTPQPLVGDYRNPRVCPRWPKCECGERNPQLMICSMPQSARLVFPDPEKIVCIPAVHPVPVPLAATICAYVALDTETSGLPNWDKPADDPSQPYLAQASMIFLDRDFAELGRFTGYVKPEGWAMEEGATKVNGLTTEFLLEHGRPVGEVLDVLEAAIKAGAVICAHNAQFDLKMGRSAFRRAGRPDLFEDTYQFCTMREWAAHHDAKWPKLAELCAMLGITQQGQHTAEGDAEAVAKILPLMRDLGIAIEGRVHRSSKPQFKDRGKA